MKVALIGLATRAGKWPMNCSDTRDRPVARYSTERSPMVVSVPLGKRSWKSLESARRWLKQETGSLEGLAGDDPRPNAERLAAVVLLSNVTDVPRVEYLKTQARDAAENIQDQEQTRDEEIENLIRDNEGTLDPI